MDYNKIFMIKASAGSGKTYQLSERIVDVICKGMTEADKCIIATFTCSAAAELVDRIYRKFLERREFKKANAFLDSVVGTVHSVCMTLLTDHAIAAGLSPSLRIIPEELTETIFWRAITGILDSSNEDDGTRNRSNADSKNDFSDIQEVIERLSLDEKGYSAKRPPWESALKDIVDKARSNGIESKTFHEIAERNIEEIKKFFRGTSSIDLKAIAEEYKAVLLKLKTRPAGLTKTGNELFDSIDGFVRFPTWKGLMGIVTSDFGKNDKTKPEIEKLIAHHEKQQVSFLEATGSIKTLEDYQREARRLLHKADQLANPKTQIPPILELLKQFALDETPTWKQLFQFMKQSFGNSKVAKELLNFKELVEFHKSLQNIIQCHILDSRELLDDIEEMIKFLFDRAAWAMEEFQHYKDQFGLADFNDLEANALKLIRKEQFQDEFSEQAHILMIDEFQDTNPMQLALMNNMHQSIHKVEGREKTVFVGDPKQSIYSFRGADSQLMIKTLEMVPSDEEHQKTLENSYRSQKELVELANYVFARTFDGTHKPSDVRLGAKRNDPEGGKITAWLLCFDSKQKGQRQSTKTDVKAMASGIADLIKQGNKPSDIAVLCRTDNDCTAIASALAERNIPSTYSSEKLLETIECQLVLAAYQYALNDRNFLAAAQYRILSGEKTVSDIVDDLIEKLPAKPRRTEGTDEKSEEYEKYRNDYHEALRSVLVENSSLVRLNCSAEDHSVTDLTPSELLERVIQTLDIDRMIDRMKFPEARRCNIDALRKAANDYIQLSSVGGLSPSPAGFLTWIQQADPEAATAVGENLVNVMTYHKAKGLEWPIVILYSLDDDRALYKRIFGTRVLSAEQFHPDNPLKGRSIHCWPYPFGRGKCDELNDRLENATKEKSSLVKKLDDLDTLDAKNLFYVGVTRAKDQVIFAMRMSGKQKEAHCDCKWIDKAAPGIFNWPTEEGTAKGDEWLSPPPQDWEPVAEELTLETKILNYDPSAAIEPVPARPIFLDPPPEPTTFYPARLNPSEAGKALNAEEATGRAVLVDDYVSGVDQDTLKLKANAISDDSATHFGNAFHQYIEFHPENDRLKIAKQYLCAWGCPENLAEVLEAQDKALYDWIKRCWPMGTVFREVPITLINRDDRGEYRGEYQGFIDMLIETDAGYVIIDHKTHQENTDEKARDEAAKHYPQLKIYSQAVRSATGKEVLGTYIHLPMCGKVYQVDIQ